MVVRDQRSVNDFSPASKEVRWEGSSKPLISRNTRKPAELVCKQQSSQVGCHRPFRLQCVGHGGQGCSVKILNSSKRSAGQTRSARACSNVSSRRRSRSSQLSATPAGGEGRACFEGGSPGAGRRSGCIPPHRLTAQEVSETPPSTSVACLKRDWLPGGGPSWKPNAERMATWSPKGKQGTRGLSGESSNRRHGYKITSWRKQK